MISNSNNPIFIPFDVPYAKKEDLTSEQTIFYNYFKFEINCKNKVEIHGNKSYIYLLASEYLDFLLLKGVNIAKQTINNLLFLGEVYNYIDLSHWIGDVYLFIGEFNQALSFYKLNPKRLEAHPANHVMNIKHHLGINISAQDLLCTEKKITKFGKDNIDKMVDFINILLEQDRLDRGEDYLAYISRKYLSEKRYTWWIFNGSTNGYELSEKFRSINGEIKIYCYYAIPEFSEYCLDISRNAENLLREDLKLPKVGEGWIAETQLYYKIKNHFPIYQVIQHASPQWLGKQHLDVFIPELNVAIEYHGRQHFEPVASFGGQKAFEDNQKRDKMKREKCQQNNVALIEVIEGYKFDELVQQIEAKMAHKFFDD